MHGTEFGVCVVAKHRIVGFRYPVCAVRDVWGLQHQAGRVVVWNQVW